MTTALLVLVVELVVTANSVFRMMAVAASTSLRTFPSAQVLLHHTDQFSSTMYLMCFIPKLQRVKVRVGVKDSIRVSSIVLMCQTSCIHAVRTISCTYILCRFIHCRPYISTFILIGGSRYVPGGGRGSQGMSTDSGAYDPFTGNAQRPCSLADSMQIHGYISKPKLVS